MEIVTMYEQLGVSRAVYEYGEAVLRDLRPRFDVIDQTAEYNQGKVLAAMQKNRVTPPTLPPPPATATMTRAGTIWNGSMQMCSTRRLRWCGLRLPAAPTP